jgi:hypothetical protein
VRLTSEARGAWEAALDKVLSPLLNAPDLAAHAAAGRFSSAGLQEGLADGLDGELAERYAPAALAPEARSQSGLALWRYARPFELAHFTNALQRLSSKDAVSPFPALATFLEHEPKLPALAHLPTVLEWIALLRGRFNRKLDREVARKTTVESVLEGLSPEERPSWEAAFDGFAAAWNANWKFVERFECLEVPKAYAGVGMSRQEAVSFCLPCDSDEGICPLALVQHLCTEHNALVAAVDERSLTSTRARRAAVASRSAVRRGGDAAPERSLPESRRGGCVGVVSSRHMTAAHALTYDLSVWSRYVALQCVDASGGGGYDFAKAEARLVARHLHQLPVLDLELPAFTFAHEQHLRGGLAPLRAKVPQAPLPADAVEAVTREFRGQVAASSRLLGALETAVAFLAATGGGFATALAVGEVLLADYLKGTLMSAGSDLGRAVAVHVRLKHVAALWSLLESFANLDPFSNVGAKYKQPLGDGQAAALEAFVDGLAVDGGERDLIRDELRKFVCEQLVEESLAASMTIASVLGHVTVNDENLYDLDWFHAFPTSVTLASAVEAYRAIEALV